MRRKTVRRSAARPGRAAGERVAEGRPPRPQPSRARRSSALGGEQVEGVHAVRELLLAGRRRVRELLVSDPERSVELVELARQARVPVRRVGASRLDRLAATEAPQGVVAYADPVPTVELDELAAREAGADGVEPPLLLVLAGVTDPRNLGAILRVADAASVSGVVLPRHRSAPLSPAAMKSAAGAAEYVPICVVPGVASALASLSELGLWNIGLDAAGEGTIFDLRLADQPLSLVLGGEGEGLPRLVRQRCDALVRIPSSGALASMNVATAAAVACFEVRRRRSWRP